MASKEVQGDAKSVIEMVDIPDTKVGKFVGSSERIGRVNNLMKEFKKTLLRTPEFKEEVAIIKLRGEKTKEVVFRRGKNTFHLEHEITSGAESFSLWVINAREKEDLSFERVTLNHRFHIKEGGVDVSEDAFISYSQDPSIRIISSDDDVNVNSRFAVQKAGGVLRRLERRPLPFEK